jgi:hypothetical protein
MFTQHEFYLRVNGSKIPCKTDDPLRACCVLSGTNGYTTVFAKDDCCNICSKKQTAKYVEPKKIVDIIFKAYGKVGIQALKLSMHKRGKYLALGKQLAPALAFVEQKVFPTLTTDYDQLVNEIYVWAKKKPPQRLYRKRKMEDQVYKELQGESISVELDDPLNEEL